MKKALSPPPLALLLLLAAAAAAVAAQSGRRPAPQPAPTAPTAADAAPAAHEQPAPVTPAGRGGSGLAFVPEAVMTRELRTLDGEAFRLTDFAGRVVVLNLWATWCGPCRRELPAFEDVRKEYSGRGVEFVALTTESPDTESDKVKKFVGQYKLGSRVGWVDGPTARVLMNGRNVIPQTIVIAADGQVVRHMRGYAPTRSAEDLREAIGRALEK